MKAIKISNIICIIISAILTAVLVIIGTLMLSNYIKHYDPTTGNTNLSGALGLVFALIFYIYALYPLVSLILAGVFQGLLKKDLNKKSFIVFGVLLIIFGYIYNGIIILVFSNKNKSIEQQ